MTITELNKSTLVLNKKEEDDELEDDELESSEEKPKKGKKTDDEKELDTDEDDEDMDLYEGEDEFYGQDLKLDAEDEEESEGF